MTTTLTTSTAHLHDQQSGLTTSMCHSFVVANKWLVLMMLDCDASGLDPRHAHSQGPRDRHACSRLDAVLQLTMSDVHVRTCTRTRTRTYLDNDAEQEVDADHSDQRHQEDIAGNADHLKQQQRSTAAQYATFDGGGWGPGCRGYKLRNFGTQYVQNNSLL